MTQVENAVAPTSSTYVVPLECFRAKGDAATSILMLPALGMAARFYRPMAEALASRGVNAVLFEQRGHGESAMRASRRVNYGCREWLEEDIPAALRWIREHIGSDRIVLMGHSLGGHLATCYVALHSDAVSRVILTASGTPWIRAFEGKTRRQLKLVCRMIPLLNAVIGCYPGERLGFGGREARRLMQDWRHLALHNVYHADGMDVDFESGIARYSGAVLGIRYDADTLAPQPAVDSMLDKFRSESVQRIVLTSDELGFRADHFKWVRRPAVTVDVIVNWLNSDAD